MTPVQIKNTKKELRIALVGEPRCGKSCLVSQFVEGSFLDDYKPTQGIDVHSKSINVNAEEYQVQISDTAGGQKFRELTLQYISNADGILMMYDMNDPEQFTVDKWLQKVCANAPEAVVMIVGTKVDEPRGECVASGEIETLAKKYDCKATQINLRHGRSIGNLFSNLVSGIQTMNKPGLEDFLAAEYRKTRISTEKDPQTSVKNADTFTGKHEKYSEFSKRSERLHQNISYFLTTMKDMCDASSQIADDFSFLHIGQSRDHIDIAASFERLAFQSREDCKTISNNIVESIINRPETQAYHDNLIKGKIQKRELSLMECTQFQEKLHNCDPSDSLYQRTENRLRGAQDQFSQVNEDLIQTLENMHAHNVTIMHDDMLILLDNLKTFFSRTSSSLHEIQPSNEHMKMHKKSISAPPSQNIVGFVSPPSRNRSGVGHLPAHLPIKSRSFGSYESEQNGTSTTPTNSSRGSRKASSILKFKHPSKGSPNSSPVQSKHLKKTPKPLVDLAISEGAEFDEHHEHRHLCCESECNDEAVKDNYCIFHMDMKNRMSSPPPPNQPVPELPPPGNAPPHIKRKYGSLRGIKKLSDVPSLPEKPKGSLKSPLNSPKNPLIPSSTSPPPGKPSELSKPPSKPPKPRTRHNAKSRSVQLESTPLTTIPITKSPPKAVRSPTSTSDSGNSKSSKPSKLKRRYATAPRNLGALIRRARGGGGDTDTTKKSTSPSSSSEEMGSKEIKEMKERIEFLQRRIRTATRDQDFEKCIEYERDIEKVKQQLRIMLKIQSLSRSDKPQKKSRSLRWRTQSPSNNTIHLPINLEK